MNAKDYSRPGEEAWHFGTVTLKLGLIGPEDLHLERLLHIDT